MRLICTILFFLFSVARLNAQSPGMQRVILLGNAADGVKESEDYLRLIREKIPFDSNTTVLFLGNNAKPGDTAALVREASIVSNSEAKAIFIPGYQDWAAGGNGGLKAVKAQQAFLESLGKNIKYYPSDGCPGPKDIKLGNDAVMLIMDSQWWLHEGPKPDIESDCKFRTREELLTEVEDFPKDNLDKLVLFVSHHPFENTGIHSGTFGIKQHIFPLTDSRHLRWLYLPVPVIGSIYPITSNAISSVQDLQNRNYQSLATTGIGTLAGVRRAFDAHPATIFLAGQEHNLQLLRSGGHFFINSGAFGASSRVRDNNEAEFVSQHKGFTVLEIGADKKVAARFYHFTDGQVKEVHTERLLDYSKMPPLAADTARFPLVAADSFIAPANEPISRSNLAKKLLIGRNYRAEWGTPVKMRVLHLATEKGGMKITGFGGGHESISLQLEDVSGKKWVFRSMNKDLSAVIPEGFQQTIASEYVHDMLSASHAYGSLTVPALQAPFGIVHAAPQMYYMPNDPALKEFKPLFANSVGLLEERRPAAEGDKTLNTYEAFNSMVDRGDHFLNQHTYLNIRLTDFLIADFDRHHGQYSWGERDSAGRKFYYPIPKDRDQTFYHNKGLIMAIMKHGDFRFMTNFPSRFRSMKNSGIVGAYLDKLFMNRLTESDWRAGLDNYNATLSDAVIEEAVSRMPPEIRAIRGAEISSKLKSRRESLHRKGMDYYRFISRKVDVPGGNKDDRFKVSGTDSGMLVQVFAKEEDGSEALRFSRTFDPSVTKEIRLFGFNGNDYFDVDESTRPGIRLRIVGGQGEDSFDIRGRARNLIYDLKTEENSIIARNRTTKLFSSRPDVNRFVFRENLHNNWSLPTVSFAVNREDGVIAGMGITYTTHGFRRQPYASQQTFQTSYAFTTKAYMARYTGEFNDIFRHFDFVTRAEIFNPVLSNFYGFGNETVKSETQPVQFYRTRYNYAAGDFLLRKRFHRNNIMHFAAGPSIYRYWYDAPRNEGRILENPRAIGLDSAGIYANKLYAGGKVAFVINTLNNELLPIRGVRWITDLTALQSIDQGSKSYSKLQSVLELYSELNQPRRVMAAVRLGGGHILSENFEYFQALTLGGNNYLRGYRINRFAGSSMAFANVELKVKLFDFNAYILKGDFGLVGFNDIGRVWMKGEESDKWHHGFGGGVYMIPFNSLMISAVVGMSEEDQLFNFTIGTRINMVFQGQ